MPKFVYRNTKSSTIITRKKHNLIQWTKDLGEVLSVKTELQDFEMREVYRLKSGTVIVDFTSNIRKETFLRKCREYNKLKKESKLSLLNTKDLKMDGPEKSIFVSESLSKKTGQLFFKARELVKRKCLVAAWTSYGQIYVKQQENQSPIRIDDEKDLLKLSL